VKVGKRLVQPTINLITSTPKEIERKRSELPSLLERSDEPSKSSGSHEYLLRVLILRVFLIFWLQAEMETDW